MNNQDTTLIEKYFAGLLTKEEKLVFEKRLKEDKAFYHLFQEEKLLQEGITFNALKETEKQLQDLESKLPTLTFSKSGKKPFLYKSKVFLGLAASVIVILVSAVVYFSNRPPDTDALFDRYFKPYPNTITSAKRSSGQNEYSEEVNLAFKHYDDRNYNDAILAFKKIIESDLNPDYLFYLANAHLANGDYNNAIDLFLQYLSNSQDFESQALWYISLCYMKLNDLNKACTFLDKSSQKDPSDNVNLNRLKRKICQSQ